MVRAGSLEDEGVVDVGGKCRGWLVAGSQM